MKRPTIIDVARAAGVSPTTVSHAYSGKRGVEDATRARIMIAAERIGYHPNHVAQSLRSGRVGSIALVSSMPVAVAAGNARLGFFMEVAASAALTAFERGAVLTLVPPLGEHDLPSALSADGVILVEPTRNDPLQAWCEARRLPVVAIGKVPGRSDIPAAELHSTHTARLLLDHLWDAGARRIALVTGTQRRNSYEETEAAYEEFARVKRMEPVARRLNETGGEAQARIEGERLLQSHPQIDGLLVPVDAFAVGMLEAARRVRRRVPEDLLVATRYDGIRAKLSSPPLTAVNLHLAEVSALAVELLFDLLSGGERSPIASIPALVPRASTGKPFTI